MVVSVVAGVGGDVACGLLTSFDKGGAWGDIQVSLLGLGAHLGARFLVFGWWCGREDFLEGAVDGVRVGGVSLLGGSPLF